MLMRPFSRLSLNVLEDPLFHHDRTVPHIGDHDLMASYHCPPWAQKSCVHTPSKNIHIDKDGFKALVDVHQFEPSEITVKTVDHTVVVEANHEERDDGHGPVERHFVRKYVLPQEFDMRSLNSSMSSDGVLTLLAPPPTLLERVERNVEIAHTHARGALDVY